MLRAFLFDLDGVLTDTSEYHYQAWQRLADDEGLPFTRADNDALRGVGRRESLNALLKGRPIDEPTAEAWMERKNSYYVELIRRMTRRDLLPGALELLAELRRAGIKIAIASASKNAALVLDRLELWPAVDAVVDGNTVTRSKPAPDLFLAAAEKLGVPPDECVVVEDAAAGVDAGIAAGMLTLGLGPQERVGHADLVLPSLEVVKLAGLLKGFSTIENMTQSSKNSVTNDQTAVAQVWGMITSNWVSQAIYVAAELRIPDLLAGKTMKADELAAAAGAHAPSMQRLLRALTTIEICREHEDGSFELTAQGELLRSDRADSLRSWALYSVGYLWPIWGHLLDSIKTGKSAREMVTGNKWFEHLERSPEIAAIFNQGMVELTRITAREVVRTYDFSGMKRIVDVGGGYGELLAAVLLANPGAHGVLFDMPHAREEGQRHLAAAGLAERCEVISGSFFEAIPGQGDIYLMKSIIHDWPDEQSQQILENCRKVMTGASRLLLIDRLYPDRLEVKRSHQAIARSDLNMLLGPGGRERTQSELARLLQATGFALKQTIPLELSFNIIEAIPDD